MYETKLDKEECQTWKENLAKIQIMMKDLDNLQEKTDLSNARQAFSELKKVLYYPRNVNEAFFQKLVFTASGKKFKGANGLDFYASIVTSVKIMGRNFKIGEELKMSGVLYSSMGDVALPKIQREMPGIMRIKIAAIAHITGDIILEIKKGFKKNYATISQVTLENKMRKGELK